MFLKLLLPSHPRIIRGGRVHQWHVTEGDWVTYGADLFDLTVDEGLSMRLASAGGLDNYVRSLIQAQESLRHLTDGEVIADKENLEDYQTEERVNWFLRVSASDRGRLVRLSARPRERREVGDVVALFTTEAGEPVERAARDIMEAAVFRTVVTPMPLWQGGA